MSVIDLHTWAHMHGGVWELCRDMYVPVPVGGADPIVVRDCRGFTRDDPAARYVARGGSYSSPAVFCASCARTVAVPANAVQDNIGFRVALVVDV